MLKNSINKKIPTNVIIKAPSRLHFNSLKMNFSHGRGCGGVGVALNEPSFCIEFARAKKITISGGNEYYRKKIKFFVKKIQKSISGIGGATIDIVDFFPDHVGLGSGTQLGLCIGTGLKLLYSKNVTPHDIATITGRAGVSGIGYYSFLNGGLVTDGGYRIGKNEEKKNFSDHASHPPKLISSHQFPDNWKILLVIPPANGLTGAEEAKFFKKNTPVSESEADQISARTFMGILPAVSDKNYFEFIENLWQVTNLGTKRCEMAINERTLNFINRKISDLLVLKTTNSETIKKTPSVWNQNKIPFFSLSSLGPAMYAVLLNGYHDVNSLFISVRNRLPASWPVYLTGVENSPAVIRQIFKPRD